MVYCSINEKMAEKINDEIEKIIEEDFKGDITTDLETYDENTITLTFSVEGGYERDINAYWGGEEYMDELIIAIKERSGIIKKLVLENRFQGVTTVGEDVFKEFKLVVNLRL